MKLYAAIVILSALALTSGSVFVKHLYSRIDALTSALAVEREKLEFEQHQNSLAVERLTALERERQKEAAVVQEVREVFQDGKFAALASKKPGLITKRMQKATQEVLTELENATDIDSYSD